MKAAAIASTLLLTALLAGCGESPNEEYQNIAAVLSPDGSKIAFVRNFHYYFNKASVVDLGGWRETVYAATIIYTIDRSTKELIKLIEVDGTWRYCSSRYDCPVNISWESNLIAYSVNQDIVQMISPDGIDEGIVNFSSGKYGPAIPFTLSGDAEKLFYMGRHPWEYNREGLYSVKLDGTDRSFVADLTGLRVYEIYDMIWDSSQSRILLIERIYGEDTIVWQIKPDGTDLRRSERGLEEYRRRRLGGWESTPPFSQLADLTRGISHAEWGVPAPEEFD